MPYSSSSVHLQFYKALHVGAHIERALLYQGIMQVCNRLVEFYVNGLAILSSHLHCQAREAQVAILYIQSSDVNTPTAMLALLDYQAPAPEVMAVKHHFLVPRSIIAVDCTFPS
jgi:hypothetical protein